jgi:hypothetical protein
VLLARLALRTAHGSCAGGGAIGAAQTTATAAESSKDLKSFDMSEICTQQRWVCEWRGEKKKEEEVVDKRF